MSLGSLHEVFCQIPLQLHRCSTDLDQRRPMPPNMLSSVHTSQLIMKNYGSEIDLLKLCCFICSVFHLFHFLLILNMFSFVSIWNEFCSWCLAYFSIRTQSPNYTYTYNSCIHTWIRRIPECFLGNYRDDLSEVWLCCIIWVNQDDIISRKFVFPLLDSSWY